MKDWFSEMCRLGPSLVYHTEAYNSIVVTSNTNVEIVDALFQE